MDRRPPNIWNKKCQKCDKIFTAEGEWDDEKQSWMFNPYCLECDTKLRDAVNEILLQKYGPVPPNKE